MNWRQHIAFALGGLACTAAMAAEAVHDPSATRALFDRYCLECHNVTDWAGEIALDAVPLDDVAGNAEVLEKAVRRMRGRLMPPPGSPQPQPLEIRAAVQWLEQNLDAASPAHGSTALAGLRRLNRDEYAYAVRDLLDLNVEASSLLPEDDRQGGFDVIADRLQVSPMFVDQYLSAARTVALLAIGNPAARAIATVYGAPSDMKAYADVQGIERRGRPGSGTQRFHQDGMPFGTRGGMRVEHVFPSDGEYSLTIGELAAGRLVPNMEFEHTVIALLDGREIFRHTIGGPKDMKFIDQGQDAAADEINQRFRDIRFRASAGQRTLAVTFLQRSFAESDDRIRTLSLEGGNDRQPAIHALQIRGPLATEGVTQSPSRQRVFVCQPASAQEERPCAERIVSTLGERAFRRPLTPSDSGRLMGFYDTGRAEGDFDAGIRRALTAILASPQFLYRTESSVAAPQREGSSSYELASRLAFFLWSSLPDDELRSVAARGGLETAEGLDRQIGRMLADPRATALSSRFAFQWLNVAKLEEIVPDPAMFPYASGQLDPRPLMREELRLFVDSIFRSDASVTELLTARHTFLNQQLAAHYGMRDVRGDRFRRVEIQNSAHRGLLGKGAILMLTAYPNRTAPVLRGAWILDHLLGTPPAPPPPNVEALPEITAGGKPLSVRELVARHSANSSCNACHGVMDPLGFALENFNAVGQFRSRDAAHHPIDASGVLPDGTALNGPESLLDALASNPEQFVQTLTEKLLAYALGRSLNYRDMPLVRRIVRESAAEDYRFGSIVRRIVGSDEFRMQPPRSGSLHASLASEE